MLTLQAPAFAFSTAHTHLLQEHLVVLRLVSHEVDAHLSVHCKEGTQDSSMILAGSHPTGTAALKQALPTASRSAGHRKPK